MIRNGLGVAVAAVLLAAPLASCSGAASSSAAYDDAFTRILQAEDDRFANVTGKSVGASSSFTFYTTALKLPGTVCAIDDDARDDVRLLVCQVAPSMSETQARRAYSEALVQARRAGAKNGLRERKISTVPSIKAAFVQEDDRHAAALFLIKNGPSTYTVHYNFARPLEVER